MLEQQKRRSDKTSALDAAVMAVMAEVDYIKKDGTNQQQGYKFASAEHIISEIRASALKHKLRIGISYSMAADLESGETKSKSVIYRVRVCADVTLRFGDEFELYTVYGEGADTGDKALPKAKTMCLKQALRQIFLIETGDADADRDTVPESTNKKRPSLPPDIQAGFENLRKGKNLTDAEFAKGIDSVMKANQGDLEAVRAYLTEKGVM